MPLSPPDPSNSRPPLYAKSVGRKLALGAVLIAAAFAVSIPPAAGGTIRTTCYQLQGTAADGTGVYSGMVAHNFYAPGTRVTLTGNGVRRFFGRTTFTVHDTGPALADGHMDVWAPGGCATWGVRTVRIRMGWPHPRARWHRGRVRVAPRVPAMR